MPLNPKQRRFVEEYLVDLNASAAARRAGYKGDPNTIGPRLLANVGVQQACQEAIQARQERTEITQDMIVRELAKIAFADQRRVMVWGPKGITLRDSSTLSDSEAAIVSEVSETVTAAGGTLKLKTHDKVGALKLLGEHLGMFRQKVEVTGKDGGPVQQQVANTSLTVDEFRQIAQEVASKF